MHSTVESKLSEVMEAVDHPVDTEKVEEIRDLEVMRIWRAAQRIEAHDMEIEAEIEAES